MSLDSETAKNGGSEDNWREGTSATREFCDVYGFALMNGCGGDQVRVAQKIVASTFRDAWILCGNELGGRDDA